MTTRPQHDRPLVVLPGSLDFGVLPVGTAHSKTVTVRGGPLTKIEVIWTQDKSWLDVQVGATTGDDIALTVTVTPPDAGDHDLHAGIVLENGSARLILPVRACWSATAVPQPEMPPAPPRPIPPVRPAVLPVQTLRGHFTAPELEEQGHQRRMRYGSILKLYPLNDEQVVVITKGGAALFNKDGTAQWTIDCPTEIGVMDEGGRWLALANRWWIAVFDLKTGKRCAGIDDGLEGRDTSGRERSQIAFRSGTTSMSILRYDVSIAVMRDQSGHIMWSWDFVAHPWVQKALP